MAWYNPMTWFKSQKTTDDIFDRKDGLLVKVGGFVNDLHFSDAEKARYNAETVKAANDFVHATLSENTERSKTRRALAKAWIYTVLGLVVLTALLGVAGAWVPACMTAAAFVWSIVTHELIFWTTLGVMGFFFGNHIYQGAKGSRVPKG